MKKLKQLLYQDNDIILDLLKQSLQLDQAIEISNIMKDEIQNYGLQIPDEVQEYINIDLDNSLIDKNKILVINKRNQKVEQTIAKVLKKLFPILPAHKVEQLQKRIMKRKSGIETQQNFEVIDFDIHYYDTISSCMTNKKCYYHFIRNRMI